jgi:glucokinase
MTKSPSPVLIADVGGTNVRFALAAVDRRPPLVTDSIRRYRVADFPSLDAAAAQYLRETGEKPRRAVFAIAGHIDNGEVRATNSPWRIVAEEARRALDLDAVRLVNDFAAQGMCLPLLDANDIAVVGKPAAPVIGRRDPQTFAVVGPGTGLGVGALLLRDGRFSALETEGGHCGYAPGTAEEIEILQHLAKRFGHVSNERLISGGGLANLHQALTDMAGEPPQELSPEQITGAAQDGSDALCVRAVEVFCAVFGAVAGDVALNLGGWDGVWLAGGLPPLLLPWLRGEAFRRRFEDKGRLSGAMRDVPTVVITHPDAGLLGVAATAVVDAGGSLLHTVGSHAA